MKPYLNEIILKLMDIFIFGIFSSKSFKSLTAGVTIIAPSYAAAAAVGSSHIQNFPCSWTAAL